MLTASFLGAAAALLVAAPKPIKPVSEPDPTLPSLAVVGVSSQLRDDLEAAAKLAGLLADMAEWNGEFGTTKRPADAKKALGSGVDDSLKCGMDAGCYVPFARKLDADRLVAGALTRDGASYLLRVVVYDRGMRSTDSIELESITLNPDELAILLPDQYNPLLERVATRRAKLTVVTEIIGAKVTLSGDAVGTAPVTRYLPAGSYTVRVDAGGHAPFEDEVVLKPAEVRTLEAVLTRTGRAPVKAVAAAAAGPREPTVFSHPGLYTAAAGVIAVAIGVGFGVAAKSVEGRAADQNGDGIRDVTRTDALAARGNAMIANVLAGAGAAVAIGAGVWIYLAPPGLTDSAGPVKESVAPLAIGVRGSF